TIDSGHGGFVPTVSLTSRRASSASVRLCAITAGQPPGTSEPTYSMALGAVSHAVGSLVPVQSNSIRKRERPGYVAVAPWLMVSGRTSGCRSWRVHRKAEPLGAHSHL